MDRLSDWRPAAWIAFCFAALAAAAALILPPALRPAASSRTATFGASLTPRTHLFGQAVTATVTLPRGVALNARFTPYRVTHRTIARRGRSVQYEFVLDCLRSACVGPPGGVREVELPPATLTLADGRKAALRWPPLRQASRVSWADLETSVLRGDMAAPARLSPDGRRLVLGICFAVGAALMLAAAAMAGLRWLPWSPSTVQSSNGRPDSSPLDYALLVAGLTAGGATQDRRAALESLAVALRERGIVDLATQARTLAWSPRPPAGEAVRRVAEAAQKTAREKS